MTEILKQDVLSPLPVTEQVVVLYAGVNGFIDEVPVEKVKEWEAAVIKHFATAERSLMEKLREAKALDDDSEAKLKTALQKFTADFVKT